MMFARCIGQYTPVKEGCQTFPLRTCLKREQVQRLRDKINRLKDKQGKLNIKPNWEKQKH